MRFAQMRVAAVTVLSGSFLILSVLGTAEAAARPPQRHRGIRYRHGVPGVARLGLPVALALALAFPFPFPFPVTVTVALAVPEQQLPERPAQQ